MTGQDEGVAGLAPASAPTSSPLRPASRLPPELSQRVPAQLWDGLDETQRGLLVSMLLAARTRHVLAFRVSIDTVFWGPWYVTMSAGRERRRKSRLSVEGQTSLSRQGGFLLGLGALLVTYALFGFFAFAYLLKSALGIDISDESSLLHPLYEWFNGR